MKNKHKVYISLGSNMGDRIAIIQSALHALSSIPSIEAFQCASLYETAPISDIPQDNYINTVCSFTTDISAEILFKVMQRIEQDHGRARTTQKNAPRLLDLDLLFYSDASKSEGDILIPHPRWMERLFVLVPLKELTDQLTIDGKLYDIGKMIEGFSKEDCESVGLSLRL